MTADMVGGGPEEKSVSTTNTADCVSTPMLALITAIAMAIGI